MSGESPSPLVLTAPLMPPCAHTEWLRLTGTIENRSTPVPSSAARIAVIRPARPPPTTMMRCFGSDTRWKTLQPEGRNRPNAEHRKHDEDENGHVGHAPLRRRRHRNSPDDRERPDPVGQMKRRREDAQNVEGEDPGVSH